MEKQKQIKNKTYMKSDEVKNVAQSVINKYSNHLVLGNAKIEYIAVYPNVSKTTVARCIRSNNELKYFSDADYIIEVSGDLWDQLTDIVKEILIYHELLHIYVTTNKSGETVYKLADHDVKDFSIIVKTFGVDWFNELKTLNSSVYELSPEQEDNLDL